MVPSALRTALDRSGRKYLSLHVLDRVPGTFAESWPESTGEPTTVNEVAHEMVRPDEEVLPEPVTV